MKVWRAAWEQFTPFLRFPPQLRKIVYSTRLVESVNFQPRKVTKTRGHFPSDAVALKLLRLAARNISDKRGGVLGTGTWVHRLQHGLLVSSGTRRGQGLRGPADFSPDHASSMACALIASVNAAISSQAASSSKFRSRPGGLVAEPARPAPRPSPCAGY